MTERGMIFNAEMVRSVLDGRKTQTRRALKSFQNAVSFTPEWDIDCQEIFVAMGQKDHTKMNPVLGAIRCPFGAVGDRLYVREAHSIRVEPSEYSPGAVWYRESDIGRKWEGAIRWTPSIHMPRWASRITLEITGVRVERLNSMTEQDAISEGCNGGHGSIPHYIYSATPHEHFRYVWQSIYGADSWQANPWVWVIEFKRVEDE